MMTELHTIEPPLHALDVPTYIDGGMRQRCVSIDSNIDLEPFITASDGMRSAGGTLLAGTDAALAPKLHEVLRPLGRRQLLDAGLWQWLCLEPLRDYVLARWCGGVSQDQLPNLKTSKLQRFVGSPTMVGMSRNAVARLFWGAEAAYATTGSYEDCALVFGSADLYVGVFEREMGLHPEAAMAIIRRLADEPEERRRQALRRLNFVLSTTALEALSAAEVTKELNALMA